MRISLAEYARRRGKDPENTRKKALRGDFKTAYKIGRDWTIEETEEWIDTRIYNGYRGINEKRKRD